MVAASGIRTLLVCRRLVIRTIGVFVSILLLTAAPRGADRVIRLTDVAAAAGIDLLNIAGSPTKDLVMDANGNGAAWFDYDRDGNLDLLIVNVSDGGVSENDLRRSKLGLYWRYLVSFSGSGHSPGVIRHGPAQAAVS